MYCLILRLQILLIWTYGHPRNRLKSLRTLLEKSLLEASVRFSVMKPIVGSNHLMYLKCRLCHMTISNNVINVIVSLSCRHCNKKQNDKLRDVTVCLLPGSHTHTRTCTAVRAHA